MQVRWGGEVCGSRLEVPGGMLCHLGPCLSKLRHRVEAPEGCQYWGCWVEGVWETLYDSSNVFSFFFEFGSVNGKNTATHILNLTNSGEADAAALQTQRQKVNTRDGCLSKFRTKSGSRPEVTSLACSFLGLK